MKKYLSIILSILLTLSCVSSPAFAGEEADELVINELGGTLSKTTLDTEITYEGSPTAKWLTTGSGWPSVTINADLTPYNTLNVQLYSPKVTDDTIGIHFRKDKTNYVYSVTVDWEGWKTLKIPLSKYAYLENAGTVTYFDIWDNGWNYTYGDSIEGSDKNGSLNIGRIWLSKDTEYVIKESDEAFGSYCAPDSEITLNGQSTSKWTTAGSGSQVEMPIDEDVSRYSMLNLELYSPKATDDTIGIHFKAPGNQVRSLTINWEGWKTVQVPLSLWTSMDVTKIIAFELWDYGWQYTYGTAHASSDKNGSLNIGRIWLDNSEIIEEEPDEPDIPDVPDEPADEIPDTEFDIVSYNSKSSYTGKFSKDTENVKYSDASAKWDVSSNNNFTYDIEDRDFTAFNYINALIYAPKATESMIMLQYMFPVSGYASNTIALDFEGWKVVSVPISNTGIGSNVITRVNLYNNGWNNKIVDIDHINIERIWLSYYDVNTLSIVDSTLADGYNRVSPLDFEVTLTVSSMLDKNVVPAAILTDSDGNITELNCEISGSKLKLTSDEALKYGEAYTLKVTGFANIMNITGSYELSFSTLDCAVNSENPVFTEGSDGAYSVTSAASNPTETAQTVILYVGEYDSDGNLVKITAASKEIAAQSGAELSAEVTPSSDENTLEAFVVSENGSPVTAAVTTLADGESNVEKSIGGDGSLTLDSASYALGVLKASVTLNADFASPVAAFVKDADGETVYVKALMTSAEGKAEFVISLLDDELKSGRYILEINSEKSTCTYEFNYASAADKAAVYEEIKNAGTIAELEDIITENCLIFNYGTDLIENNKTARFLAEVIKGNTLPGSFDELNKLTDTALSLRDEINSCDWNKLPGIIEENYDVLLCPDLESAFEKLTSEQKSKVAMLLKENCPYELFSDFASDLEEFIDDVKSEPKKNNSSGGGGGGGGSSGGSSYSVPMTSVPQVSVTPEAVSPFDDLSSVAWAQESILTLYEAGVISPSADRRFRPNDSITREEYTKLICAAFKLEDSSAVCSFADVDTSAWYYTYIASMNAKGIVTGYGDSFGIGDNITREDMAVIAMRALSYLGITLDESAAESFTDEALISDYAINSVYALKNAGIINGMGDGSFAPQNNATRAQAAKIICGLMQLSK